MISFKEYKRVESLEEAYELNQKKSNRVVGGMLWLRMSKNTFGTAIDLSGLGLDQIEETPDAFYIGCMTPLRNLELHEGLNQYTNQSMREALRHIVGVQFRNLATVGGSIFGRYGFSDVLTMFLCMDSYVKLYKGGIIALKDFINMPKNRDILVQIIVKKEKASFNYSSVRNHAKTDFPVLTCAAARLSDGTFRFSVGARPQKACLLMDEQGILSEIEMKTEISEKEKLADQFAEYAKETVLTGDNMRGSKEYRMHLTGVLVKRAIMELITEEDSGKDDTVCR